MYIIVNGPDQCIGCHHISIAGGRNLLDDHKKGSVKGYISLVDLMVQVKHYITIGAVSSSSYFMFIIVNCPDQ